MPFINKTYVFEKRQKENLLIEIIFFEKRMKHNKTITVRRNFDQLHWLAKEVLPTTQSNTTATEEKAHRTRPSPSLQHHHCSRRQRSYCYHWRCQWRERSHCHHSEISITFHGETKNIVHFLSIKPILLNIKMCFLLPSKPIIICSSITIYIYFKGNCF